jgi:hypothetical protein
MKGSYRVPIFVGYAQEIFIHGLGHLIVGEVNPPEPKDLIISIVSTHQAAQLLLLAKIESLGANIYEKGDKGGRPRTLSINPAITKLEEISRTNKSKPDEYIYEQEKGGLFTLDSIRGDMYHRPIYPTGEISQVIRECFPFFIRFFNDFGVDIEKSLSGEDISVDMLKSAEILKPADIISYLTNPPPPHMCQGVKK